MGVGMRTDGPGAYRFWYRESPRYFQTIQDISVDEPPMVVSGMTLLYLDMEGRLHWFLAAPPQREPPAGAPATPDWSIAFREAGLDLAQFTPAPSTIVPFHAYDTRAAWDGSDPAHPELKTHIEELRQENEQLKEGATDSLSATESTATSDDQK